MNGKAYLLPSVGGIKHMAATFAKDVDFWVAA